MLAEEKQRFLRQATALQRAAEMLQVAATRASTLRSMMGREEEQALSGTDELQNGCVRRREVS